MDWIAGYQYFGYQVQFPTLTHFYHAHLPYTSLRISFGGASSMLTAIIIRVVSVSPQANGSMRAISYQVGATGLQTGETGNPPLPFARSGCPWQ